MVRPLKQCVFELNDHAGNLPGTHTAALDRTWADYAGQQYSGSPVRMQNSVEYRHEHCGIVAGLIRRSRFQAIAGGQTAVPWLSAVCA
jgi:hypothetical protein